MTMITGDFNYPGIRWVDGSGFVNSDIGVEYEFTNLLTADAFLYQLVDAPTRGINILDLVFSSNVDLVDTVFVENTNGLPSDHKSISFNLFRLLKLNNQPPRYIYDITNADFESLRTHLSENINDISHENTVDALKSWKNDFLEAVNVFVPRRKVRHPQRAPWIDCDLAYAIKKKKTTFGTIKCAALMTPQSLRSLENYTNELKTGSRRTAKLTSKG